MFNIRRPPCSIDPDKINKILLHFTGTKSRLHVLRWFVFGIITCENKKISLWLKCEIKEKLIVRSSYNVAVIIENKKFYRNADVYGIDFVFTEELCYSKLNNEPALEKFF